MLPALERRHDVLAVTLGGHAGGPPLPSALTETTLADWVILDGVDHCPQLDVPVEAAELILGFTADPTRGTPPAPA